MKYAVTFISYWVVLTLLLFAFANLFCFVYACIHKLFVWIRIRKDKKNGE